MRFNPKARLDSSRVSDAGRGSGGGGLGGGGSRLPIPGGVAGGGGVIGVIVVVVFIAIQLFSGSGGGGGLGGGTGGGGLDASRFSDTGRYASCKTGADANKSADCARVAVENSLRDFWGDTLGDEFTPVDQVVTFEGSIGTGCGGADSSVGPFYCPSDQRIYLDSGFFDEVLERQLGGPDGGFVEPYVLAHEYGHHISNLIGTIGNVKGDTGPQSSGVRLELQADCFAGMWARSATETEDADGNVLFAELNQQDIDLALEAAAAVGDDRIQKKTTGQVDSETWTHGSAANRQKWFGIGFEQGSLDACDTFSVDKV
ncbi:neutral zinc metallopeptidase [Nocardioides sp.]|uniref:KPN_02809 family neutral zinc metallopeptidase n=1 Tax=Nocardioides sp. TaxID=35761 RepID=UPI002720D4C6|nr:neutral zinc metallopeptidase [Nocardioides sp.]MDO9455891.1 neutral zinc metallopeptidase [Nocardioides sp.]